ncbi:MAG: hypothetical protein O3A84_06000, partial [Proteobacteria bacterium]|nr:hypothetical protein [Pseudomonadota bacterium]
AVPAASAIAAKLKTKLFLCNIATSLVSLNIQELQSFHEAVQCSIRGFDPANLDHDHCSPSRNIR